MSVRIERGGFTPRQPTSYPARQSWFTQGESPALLLWTTALDLKRKPVGNDLRACIPIERRQRTINRRKRTEHAIWIERSSQPLQERPQITVGQAAFVRAGKKGTQIANYR